MYSTSSDIERISYNVLGYKPKEEQLAAVISYKNGHDTILVAPTGFGKSYMYQIAPFLYDTERYSAPFKVQHHEIFASSISDCEVMPVASDSEDMPVVSDSEDMAVTTSSTPLRPVTEVEAIAAFDELSTLMDDVSLGPQSSSLLPHHDKHKVGLLNQQ